MNCRTNVKRLAHHICFARRASSNFYQRSGGLLSVRSTKKTTTTTPEPIPSRKYPPHIMEISVNELSAYQNDLQSLETFVDQLVHLPMRTFAQHVNAVLEMTKAHGLRGSKLAQKLLPALKDTTAAIEQQTSIDDDAPNDGSPMTEISTAIAKAEYQQDLHIFNVKRHEINELTDIYQMEKFVTQIEDAATSLTNEQLEQHVLPLSRVTAMRPHQVRGAQLTERILLAVQKSSLKVPENLYNRSMIAWGNQKHAVDCVKRIWGYLVDDKDATLLQRHYKSLIRGIAQTDASEAYHILRHEFEPAAGVPALLGEVESTKEAAVAVPDLAVYNLVAMAYAKSPMNIHPHKPMRVLEIFERVKQLHGVTGTHELDGHSYVALFLAHRTLLRMKQSVNAAELTGRIESLLDAVHERVKKGVQEPLQQQSVDRKRSLDGNDFVNRDSDAVLFPLSMSWAYEIMIEAYLKSNQNDKAIQMVTDMIHGTNGVHPCSPRNSTLVMLTHRLTPEQRTTILQRCILAKEYKRVHFLHVDMEDWASLPAPQPPYIAELVEAMLLHAFANFNAKRNKPTGLTFRIAIKAWMRCGDKQLGLTHIDNLMTEMMNVSKVDSWYSIREVHVRLWMTAYAALCRTGQRYAVSGATLYPAEHCERILTLSRPLCTRLNVEASFVAIAIRAWANQEGDDIDELQRLERVNSLLNSLKSDEIPVYPANWVLSTCCRDYNEIGEQQRAYQIASSIFMRKDIHLNSRSYELMVEIVHKIRRDEVLVMELFRRACLAGMVSQELVWRVAELVTSADDLQKLFHLNYSFAQMIVSHKNTFRSEMPPSALRLENLPREWSANRDRNKSSQPQQKTADGEAHGEEIDTSSLEEEEGRF